MASQPSYDACKDRATVVIAVGNGQELYKDHASAIDWLDAYSKAPGTVTRHQLRKNFRNAPQQYYFAQAFFEAWPSDYERASRGLKEGISKQKSLFDREAGDWPRLLSLPVSADEADFNYDGQDEVFARTIYDVIKDEYERMVEDGNMHPVGLLILVPGLGLHYRAAHMALERLADEKTVDYIDYVEEANRRRPPLQNQIRLSTFHSARGLEAEHVIVLGLEKLANLAEATQTSANNLAFIALSRAVLSTVIAMCRWRE